MACDAESATGMNVMSHDSISLFLLEGMLGLWMFCRLFIVLKS